MDNNLNNIENDDDDECASEYVLSVCWDTMVLAAAYFDLTLLELHVS